MKLPLLYKSFRKDGVMMYISITLKLLIGSAIIFFILRLTGKKTTAELTPFDLIFFLVLGGILETPLYDSIISIWEISFGLLVWGGWVLLINYTIKKTLYVSKVLQGEPSVLISEGKINRKALEENHINLEQLRALLRQNGCFTLRDVQYGILEIDVKISIIRKDQKEIPSILLIDEGRLDEDTRESIGRDKEWLLHQLKEQDYNQIEEVFYCEWIPEDGLHIVAYEAESHLDIKLDG